MVTATEGTTFLYHREGRKKKKKKEEYSQTDNKEKFVGTPHPIPDTDHPYNIIR